MVLKDGTYVIVSALDTSKAMDVLGASDADCANVQLYTADTQNDAQIVHVIYTSSGFQILFSLSGKCLDVPGGTVKNGINVQQYDDNDSRAQRWAITADGKTVSYGGASYPTYVIASYGSQTFVCDAANGSSSIGTKVQLWTANATSAQRWAFVPVDTLQDGTYAFHSALDQTACMDVSGGSSANGANVQLYADNGTNAQAWVVKNDAQTGQVKIVNANSGKALDVAAAGSEDGTNVQIYADNGTRAQAWVAVKSGFLERNGQTVPAYTFHVLNGSGKVMDAANGQTSLGTNVQIWSVNGTDAQRWEARPTEALGTGLSVPASIAASIDSAAEKPSNALAANSIDGIYFDWICASEKYQVRYRERCRKAGFDIGEWSDFKSVYDGSVANGGWGDLYSSLACAVSGGKRICPCKVPVSLDNVTDDYAEMECQVRAYADAYGPSGAKAHGNSSSGIVKLIWKPSVSVESIMFSFDGLSIAYDSDYKRSGNSLSIDAIYCNGKKLCGGSRFTGLGYSGSVTVPVSDLSFVPDDGAMLDVFFTYATDTASTSGNISKAVSWNAMHGLSVNPSYSDSDGYGVLATVGKADTNECYLMVEHGHRPSFEKMEIVGSDSSTVTFRVLPPFNRPYTLFFLSRTGSDWAAKADTRAAFACRYYVWNFGDDFSVLVHGAGDAPSLTRKLDADISTHLTTGREHQVAHFGNSVASDLSVSGALRDGWTKNYTIDAFDRLAYAHYAVFRTPAGDWANVAVSSVSMPQTTTGYGTLSVSQIEVSI